MAGETVRIELDGKHGLDVAGLAFGLGVSAEQCMPCVNGMIKAHVRPSGAYMAGIASFAEMTLMVIVFFVTGETIRRQMI